MTIILPQWLFELMSAMMMVTASLQIATFYWRMKITKIDKENLLAIVGVLELALPFISEPRIHLIIVDMIKTYKEAYGRRIV